MTQMTMLYAIWGQRVGRERFTMTPDPIAENLKKRKTKCFAKF